MPDPRAHLAAWGLADAPVTLVATRENLVYRVETPDGPAALRLRRPGYRSLAEIRTELDWMAALDAAGFPVPRPLRAQDGSFFAEIDGSVADMVGWLDGTPMGVDGVLSEADDLPARYGALGVLAARLHDISDGWATTAQVDRPAWDAEGLLGEAPLWGRFWESPTLDAQARALIDRARHAAAQHLDAIAPTLDYGLIHADMLPENIIVRPDGLAVIDFDDGGWGFRIYELATIANRALRHPEGTHLIDPLVEGYQSQRDAGTHALPLFQLLRAFTYLGWIIPRIDEPGARDRATRFTALATTMAHTYLETEGAAYDR